jgi:rhodanese-related sulfurtransferase
MQFVMSNIWLILLAVISGGMLLWPMLQRGALGIPDVSPADAVALINREHAMVLDVRDEAEFSNGHITDAKHIPLAQLPSRLEELARFRDKPIVVQCQGGVRSASACAMLKKNDFNRIYNLKGGMAAWIEAKLPVMRD